MVRWLSAEFVAFDIYCYKIGYIEFPLGVEWKNDKKQISVLISFANLNKGN